MTELLRGRRRPSASLTAQWFGVTQEQLNAIGSPSVLLGTLDEMCEKLEARRERLGISYINCGADMIEAMAPVVARLAGR